MASGQDKRTFEGAPAFRQGVQQDQDTLDQLTQYRNAAQGQANTVLEAAEDRYNTAKQQSSTTDMLDRLDIDTQSDNMDQYQRAAAAAIQTSSGGQNTTRPTGSLHSDTTGQVNDPSDHVINSVKNSINQAIDNVQSSVKQTADDVHQDAERRYDGSQSNITGNTSNQTYDAAKSTTGAILDKTKAVAGSVYSGIAGTANYVYEGTRQTIQGTHAGLQSKSSETTSTTNSSSTYDNSMASGLNKRDTQSPGTTYDQTKQAVGSTVEKITGTVQGVIDSTKQTVSDTHQGAKDRLNSAYNSAAGTASDLSEGAKVTGSQVYDSTTTVAASAGELVQKVAGDINQGTRNVIGKAYDHISGAYKGVKDGAKESSIGQDLSSTTSTVDSKTVSGPTYTTNAAGTVQGPTFTSNATGNVHVTPSSVSANHYPTTGSTTGIDSTYQTSRNVVGQASDTLQGAADATKKARLLRMSTMVQGSNLAKLMIKLPVLIKEQRKELLRDKMQHHKELLSTFAGDTNYDNTRQTLNQAGAKVSDTVQGTLQGAYESTKQTVQGIGEDLDKKSMQGYTDTLGGTTQRQSNTVTGDYVDLSNDQSGGYVDLSPGKTATPPAYTSSGYASQIGGQSDDSLQAAYQDMKKDASELAGHQGPGEYDTVTGGNKEPAGRAFEAAERRL
eukprot:SM000062S19970  [mRNA]  locus=s62:629657:633345:- [translate_table: standard]